MNKERERCSHSQGGLDASSDESNLSRGSHGGEGRLAVIGKARVIAKESSFKSNLHRSKLIVPEPLVVEGEATKLRGVAHTSNVIQVTSGSLDMYNSHLILGEGSGLIRANDSERSEGLSEVEGRREGRRESALIS